MHAMQPKGFSRCATCVLVGCFPYISVYGELLSWLLAVGITFMSLAACSMLNNQNFSDRLHAARIHAADCAHVCHDLSTLELSLSLYGLECITLHVPCEAADTMSLYLLLL